MLLSQSVRTLTRPFILLTTVLICLGSANTASAQAPNFGIRPQTSDTGYFEYTIAAGEKVQDVLVANNPGDTPLSINVRAVRGATMAAGGISFPEDTSGPAQWVKLQDTEIVALPAQTTLNLPFEVAVPADTPAGEYVVGFLAAPVDEPEAVAVAAEGADSGSSFEVKVVSRVGVAVVITVPGANECEAVISSLTSASQSGRWQLGIGLQNTGNLHFKGSGEVIARPADGGEPVASSPFEVGYFIPGDVITYPLTLEPYPAAGDYQLEVNLLTDCGFAAAFNQPLNISPDSVEQAAAEAIAENPSSAAAIEAARVMAQAELVRSIGLLVGAVAALVIAVIVVMVIMRRRNAATPHAATTIG